MNATTATIPNSRESIFRSTLFQAPGRPRPLARRLAIGNRVIRSIRRFMDERGFNEVPISYAGSSLDEAVMASHQIGYRLLEGMLAQGFPAVWCEGEQRFPEIDGQAPKSLMTGFKLVQGSVDKASVADLADLLESFLKTVATDLGADLLGGRHVTRLDRMLSLDHPRLSYDQTLAVLNDRGFSLKFGDEIPPEALATLTRYLNNLPFFLMREPGAAGSLIYVLPFAGQVAHGLVHESAADSTGQQGGFTVEVARLLQFFMGLSSVTDAVIQPLGSTQMMALQDLR